MKWINRLPFLWVGLFILIIGGSFPASTKAAGLVSKIVVSELENEAQFRASSEDNWQPLIQGVTLYPNYEIKTLSNTRLTIRLGDGSEVRVAPNSVLRINSQTNPESAQFDMQLMIGKAWAKFRKNLRIGAKLILRTAHAQININGTSYEASVNADSTQVRVFSGEVAVQNAFQSTGSLEPTEIAPPHEVSREQWQVIVAQFYQVVVYPNQRPSNPTSFQWNQGDDDWADWNMEKDETL